MHLVELGYYPVHNQMFRHGHSSEHQKLRDTRKVRQSVRIRQDMTCVSIYLHGGAVNVIQELNQANSHPSRHP